MHNNRLDFSTHYTQTVEPLASWRDSKTLGEEKSEAAEAAPTGVFVSVRYWKADLYHTFCDDTLQERFVSRTLSSSPSAKQKALRRASAQ